jgi:hypothetical protein
MKRTIVIRKWGATWVATWLAILGTMVGLARSLNAEAHNDASTPGPSGNAKPSPKLSRSPTPSRSRSAGPSPSRPIRRIAGSKGTGRGLLTLAVLLTTLCTFAPSAAAVTAAVETQHALKLRNGVLSGQLSAAVSACLSARAITLYRSGASGSAIVASAQTDINGTWTRAASDLPNGEYYATAAPKEVKIQGRKQTCAAATSNSVTIAVDADKDGYTTTLGDCDDASPAIHPGATELLNGVDDDCDGLVDEGYATTPTTPTTCWLPSSDPITATTTWSQRQSTAPCTWELRTWTVLPGSVFMASNDWLIEYRPAAGQPVALEYDGQGWGYYAAHANCCWSGA